MVDNLNPRDGRDEASRPNPFTSPSSSPMSDREVPLAGGHPSLAVQQWLDGEATESTARRSANPGEVELWSQINAETERRRRMLTPVHVMERIMEALPAVEPATPLAWWQRQMTLSPTVAFAAAAGLVAVGALVGIAIRGR
jgi:hypothetical protein